MAENRVSYMKLLKEAIQGHEPAAPHQDVKGPMLDTILKYKGDGELETHKDAASILERYYFGENADKGISITEEEAPIDNEIDVVPDQNVEKTKKEIEKELTEADDEDEEKKDDDEDKEDKKKDDEEKVEENAGLDNVENSIIEKLIEEMEDDLSENRVAGDRGAGTQAAGTLDGNPEDIIAGTRKDNTSENVAEQDDEEEEKKDDDAEEKKDDEKKDDEDLDVDKELEVNEGGPLGPIDVDKEDPADAEVREAFEIFKEAIESDDEFKSDEVRV